MNFGSGAGAGLLGRAAEGTAAGVAKLGSLKFASDSMVMPTFVKSPASRMGETAAKGALADALLVTACSGNPASTPGTCCAWIADTLPKNKTAPAKIRLIIIPLGGPLTPGICHTGTVSKREAICLCPFA